jgi:hypothetical protein
MIHEPAIKLYEKIVIAAVRGLTSKPQSNLTSTDIADFADRVARLAVRNAANFVAEMS